MKRLVASLLMIAFGAACTSHSARAPHVAAPLVARAPSPFAPIEDLAPEQLMEPAIQNKTLALARRAAQNAPFCTVMVELDQLQEPAHDDVDAAIRYAQSYYNVIFSLDPRARIHDPDATIGKPKDIVLPPQVVRAALVERQQMYAYLVRVRFAQLKVEKHTIAASALQARLDDAFVRLATSEYTQADSTLSQVRTRACSGG